MWRVKPDGRAITIGLTQAGSPGSRLEYEQMEVMLWNK